MAPREVKVEHGMYTSNFSSVVVSTATEENTAWSSLSTGQSSN